MRLHRRVIEKIYGDAEKFSLGEGKVLRDGKDVTIIALGAVLVPEAVKAAKTLEEQGISAAVIDILSVKPLDRELVLDYAAKTGRIITAENHQVSGGLGSAVAELCSKERPTSIAMIGVQDEFGEVGTQGWLQERFKMTAAEIILRAKELVEKVKN
jgi:transketolase